MEKPTEPIPNCPVCPDKDTIELKDEQISFLTSTGNRYVGYMWVYHCKCCDERFTTTESDEISLKYLYKLTMPEDVTDDH